MHHRRAIIISIGNELISGQTVDTNAAWVADRLGKLGLVVIRHITIGDDVDDIESTVSAIFDLAEVVILTGGLGPTPDDLTREGLAAALATPLEINMQALANLEAFFLSLDRTMPESNRIQAMIPTGCDILPNECGTAPGIYCKRRKTQLFALPGVPYEMKAMFNSGVKPLIIRNHDRGAVIIERLQTFGKSEATIGEILVDIMAPSRNPRVGTSVQAGVIGIRIEARADIQDKAAALVLADITEIRSRLGQVVFGADDEHLEHAVAKLLKDRGETVATAESCTGGLLAKCLTDVPGSSAYFSQGFIVYSSEAKVKQLGVSSTIIEEHGSVSEEVAEEMARGCLTVSGTNYAIVITGIAGPSGGSSEKPVGLVYLALADENQVAVKKLLLGDHLTRAQVRDRSCKHALSMLRLRLLKAIEHGCD